MNTDGPDAAALNAALIDKLKYDGSLHQAQVEAAFRAVPRHVFLPGVALEEVYSDEAIPIKRKDGRAISSSSQPAMMAIMLEQLALRPGHRVLEIGAGTGYNAALMAHLVGETGLVVTVDIDEDIVEDARSHLAAAGFNRVQAVCADGGFGYPPAAPYDRIILTVGAGDIAPAWLEQLAPDGRLVLPLAVNGVQKSTAFERANGHLSSVSIVDCGFIMLRGAFAEVEFMAALGPDPGIYLSCPKQVRVDAVEIYERLSGPSRDRPTGVRLTERDVWRSLSLWLALREPHLFGLSAEGEMAERDLVPPLLGLSGKWKWRMTSGVLSEHGLAVLTRVPIDQDENASFELYVRSFGAADDAARRLVEQVRAWDAAGRPASEGLRIRAYPKDAGYAPAEGELAVQKRWTQFVFDWPR